MKKFKILKLYYFNVEGYVRVVVERDEVCEVIQYNDWFRVGVK